MPYAPLQEPAVRFGAPIGRRVRLLTTLPFLLILAAVAFNVGLARFLHLRHAGFLAVSLAPAAGLLIVVPTVCCSVIRGYDVRQGELRIRRVGRVNRFALAGLRSAEPGAELLAGSSKIRGNDGAGAIAGRFRSATLGTFQAFVTDPDRVVVLRWPDRCIVVSPDRPAEFAELARRQASSRR